MYKFKNKTVTIQRVKKGYFSSITELVGSYLVCTIYESTPCSSVLLIRTQVVLEVAPVLVEVSGVAMDREVAVVVEVRHRHVKGVAGNINCPNGKIA